MVLIKYLHKKGLALEESHADIVATLGDTAPLYAKVKRWAAHFKVSKGSLEDDDVWTTNNRNKWGKHCSCAQSRDGWQIYQ